MKRTITHTLASLIATICLMFVGTSYVHAEDAFEPAYEKEATYDGIYDPKKYVAYHQGRKYYTNGKKNGFRVNENNEESTDETVGILTFILAPAAIIYMNFVGWWD